MGGLKPLSTILQYHGCHFY